MEWHFQWPPPASSAEQLLPFTSTGYLKILFIVILLIVIGLIFSKRLFMNTADQIAAMRKAVILNSEDEINYALQNYMGYVFLNDTIEAKDPVNMNGINGNYLYVSKQTSGNGEVKTYIKTAEKFMYRGKEYPYEKLKFSLKDYLIRLNPNENGNTMYCGVPAKIKTILFTKLEKGTVTSDVQLIKSDDALIGKKKYIQFYQTLMAMFWILHIFGGVICILGVLSISKWVLYMISEMLIFSRFFKN